MSQDNVAVFAQVSDAYRRRDVEALLEHAHQDVEWHSAAEVVLGGEGSVYRGHDGLRTMFRELDEVLEVVEIEWDNIRDLGDRIVATGRFHVRGRESGAGLESGLSGIADFSGGKLLRVRTYLDHQQALEVAGLE